MFAVMLMKQPTNLLVDGWMLLTLFVILPLAAGLLTKGLQLAYQTRPMQTVRLVQGSLFALALAVGIGATPSIIIRCYWWMLECYF